MPPAGYGGPNPGVSGNDPRGRYQNQIGYQQQRYENQQGPLAASMAQNYARSSEADYGDRTNIMNQYDAIINGAGGSSGGGGGGGGNYGVGQYTPFTVNAGKAGYTDPFKSYGGYEEFSKTGGYSDNDVANMRARGIAPIRAAYSNAQQEMGRQRSLQGGYSPNAAASLVKMAREQGQSGADASTNLEAGLAQMRQQGRLAGLGGMSGIEGQRLNADVDISKYNTGLDFQGQTYNAGANERAQANNIQAQQMASSARAAGAQYDAQNQLAALSGKRLLYGTTPGASQLFGSQAIDITGQGGNAGMGYINAEGRGSGIPGAYDRAAGYINDAGGILATGIDAWENRNRNGTGNSGGGAATTPYQTGGQYTDPYDYENDPNAVDAWGNPLW